MERHHARRRSIVATAVAAVTSVLLASLVFAPGASATVDPPSAISAARAATGNTVNVSWTNPSSNFASASLFSWDAASAGTSTAVTSGSCTTAMTVTSCSPTLTRTSNFWLSMTSTDGTTTSADSARVLVPALPTTPTGVTVTPASSQLAVSWTASTSAGNPVTSYTAIAYTLAAGGAVAGQCSTATTSCDITGLTNSTTYYVDITAANADGSSDPLGTRVSGTPIALPSAPTSVTATGDTDSITIAWSAPATDGGSAITAYTATLYDAASGGSAVNTCTPASLTSLRCTISSLTSGTTYYASVVATNVNGTGPASSRLAIKAGTLPGTPRSVSASRTDGGATISWHAPSSAGSSAITGYTAYVYASTSNTAPVVASCTDSTALECTVTGLVNETTYYVSVTATSAVGDGTPSSRVATSGAGTPSAPRSVVVERGNGFVRASWTAPLTTGNSRIIDYTARAYSSETGTTVLATCTVTTTICILGPIANGTNVYVDVVARNALRTGPASSPRVSMTPAQQATAPRSVTAYDEGTGVRVNWLVPTADGGLPITSYEAKAWTSATGGSERGKCVTEGDTCAIEGLTGAPVFVDVTSVTAAGNGATSTPRVRVVLQPSAGTVQALSVSPSGRLALVNWFPPARTGTVPVASYAARIVSAGSTVGTCTAQPGKKAQDPISCTVKSLPRITGTVRLEVDAIGADGVVITTTADTPWVEGAPTLVRIVQALPGERTLTVAWQVPVSDGGSDITTFKVRAFENQDDKRPSATCTAKPDDKQLWQTCVLTDLRQFEPYYVEVSAVNASGSKGFTKAVVAEALPSPPSAPLNVELFRVDKGVHVKWDKPLTDGGYRVEQILVQAWSAREGGNVIASCKVDIPEDEVNKAAGDIAVPTNACDITGQADGDYLWVDAIAVNTVGDGTPSPRAGYTVLAALK